MSNTIQKPARECKRIKAAALKPPALTVDPDTEKPLTWLVYVDATSFKEVHLPCTQACFAKVEGGPPVKGEPHPGLDMKTNLKFVVIVSPDGLTALDVDVLPENQYERGMIPEELKGKTELEIEIDQTTGGLTVLAIPPKTSNISVDNILKSLDKLTEVAAGNILPGGHRVLSVAGNRLSIKVNKAGAK